MKDRLLSGIRLPFLVAPEFDGHAAAVMAAIRAGVPGFISRSGRVDVRELEQWAEPVQGSGGRGNLGLRWVAQQGARGLGNLAQDLGDVHVPILLLGGYLEKRKSWLTRLCKAARKHGDQVLLEVVSVEQAVAAAAGGFDGVVLRGMEAGGLGSTRSTFLLAQAMQNQVDIPYWIQGALGPETAAACWLSGAGVVLGDELILTDDSGVSDALRRRLLRPDGLVTESLTFGTDWAFRVWRGCRKPATVWPEQVASEGSFFAELAEQTATGISSEMLGQGILLAGSLAMAGRTVAGVLDLFRERGGFCLKTAAEQQLSAAGSPLAEELGTQFPIVQGPMTRVSDRPEFARAVFTAGGLPFVALGVLSGEALTTLLRETKALMGDDPWGVGILGFIPLALRREQQAAIQQVRPGFVIIAGGNAELAAEWEQEGIQAYLHVPSVGLLRQFLADGARKFIFEGRDCGGHVGPLSSFVLWQLLFDELAANGLRDSSSLRILLAGGIHDAQSSAMAAVAAAGAAAKGARIGFLLGTAYLLTREARETGAVTPLFQEVMRENKGTVLLKSAAGQETRCAPTEFAREFERLRGELLQQGLDSNTIRMKLEVLNLGRLRLAAKGVRRKGGAVDLQQEVEAAAAFEKTNKAVQRREGLFMIGEVAALTKSVVPLSTLHKAVGSQAVSWLQGRLRATFKLVETGKKRSKPVRRGEPIAIVGMSGLFPDAPDLAAYWKAIVSGHNAVREVPPERWDSALYYTEDRQSQERSYARHGAFLTPVRFDPMKFQIPPVTVGSVEVIQLMALELAWQALAHAGYLDRAFPRDRTAVIFASSGVHEVGLLYAAHSMLPKYLQAGDFSDAEREELMRRLDDVFPRWTEDSFPGCLPNVITGRIANRLNLSGPNFVVDAACAASMAAVWAAVANLRARSCDMALAGAVDQANHPFAFMSFAKTQALTAGDCSRPFDEEADGIVLGEGGGVVVLKRLADAERDGDAIYAVIRGVGMSSDGRNSGITAPFPAGQELALRRAYTDAGISPETIELVEAHATGTAVGDVAEIRALNAVFAEGAGGRCAIGSVKSMIGHTKTVAGMASLIKSVLALQHRTLPPTINVKKPNHHANFGEGPFYLNTRTRPWIHRRTDVPRRAGVSAFGFGGSNFHLVLEEHADSAWRLPDLTPRAVEPFFWRRPDRSSLLATLRQFALLLAEDGLETLSLARLAMAVAADEAIFSETQDGAGARAALVADSLEALRSTLTALLAAVEKGDPVLADGQSFFFSDAEPVRDEQIGFLFPGQGAQYPDMFSELAISWPGAAEHFARADRVLADFFPQPLSEYIFPTPEFDKKRKRAQREALNDTRMAQPALGVVNSLAALILQQFGLRPAVVAGHSYGEYPALWTAGAFDLEGLWRISAQRGAAIHQAVRDDSGGLLAVAADGDAVRQALEKLDLPVYVANLNSPRQTVIAGPVEALAVAEKQLPEQGLAVRQVPASAAFHSPYMEPSREQFARDWEKMTVHPPHLPIYSNVTGKRYGKAVEEIGELLIQQLISPVCFVDEVRQMYKDGCRVFIEAGPNRILSGLVSRILGDRPHTMLTLDQPHESTWKTLGTLLTHAAVLGAPIDFSPWFEGRGGKAESVRDCLDAVRREAAGKPTDWWLYPDGARPVGKDGRAGGTSKKTSKQSPKAPAAVEDASRQIMLQWLEMQKAQNRMQAEFLAQQEQLLGGTGGLASAVPVGMPTSFATPPAALPDLRRLLQQNGAEGAASTPDSPSQSVECSDPVPAVADAPDPGRTEVAADGNIPSVAAFREALFREVSERTGYPLDMLDPDTSLEAGLGIDSIKVMEIFGALKPYHAGLIDEDEDEEELLAELAGLKTLNALVSHYADRREQALARQGKKKALTVAATPVPDTASPPSPASLPEIKEAVTLERRIFCLAGMQDALEEEGAVDSLSGTLVMIFDPTGTATGLAILRAVRAAGAQAFRVLDAQKKKKDLKEKKDSYRVEPDTVESWSALAARIIQDFGHAPNRLVLLPTTGAGKTVSSPTSLIMPHFYLIRAFADSWRNRQDAATAVRLVNVTLRDGGCGLLPIPSSLTQRAIAERVSQAGTAGFYKALAREWRFMQSTTIDLAPSLTTKQRVAEIMRLLQGAASPLEFGWDGRERRMVQLVPAPLPATPQADALPGANSVLLLIGAGYGIGAVAAEELARQTGARLVLFGRSDPETPEPTAIRNETDPVAIRRFLLQRGQEQQEKMAPRAVEQQLRGILRARKVRTTLDRLRQAGSEVDYRVVDVCDSSALQRAVLAVRKQYGQLDAVVHAAGILADGPVEKKSPAAVQRVLDTKIGAAFSLLDALKDDAPNQLIFYTSVAGVTGNAMQTDYSAANAALAEYARILAVRQPVVAIDWGPWEGGMVSDLLREAYARRGISLIPETVGAQALLAEWAASSSPVAVPEVVWGCALDRLLQTEPEDHSAKGRMR